jgi:hypothetical protein
MTNSMGSISGGLPRLLPNVRNRSQEIHGTIISWNILTADNEHSLPCPHLIRSSTASGSPFPTHDCPVKPPLFPKQITINKKHSKEAVVNRHEAQTNTSEQARLGIITSSKPELITSETEHASNIQEVVMPTPSTSTTTSKALHATLADATKSSWASPRT